MVFYITKPVRQPYETGLVVVQPVSGFEDRYALFSVLRGIPRFTVSPSDRDPPPLQNELTLANNPLPLPTTVSVIPQTRE